VAGRAAFASAGISPALIHVIARTTIAAKSFLTGVPKLAAIICSWLGSSASAAGCAFIVPVIFKAFALPIAREGRLNQARDENNNGGENWTSPKHIARL
jgi:hypothetical protein